jgi:hypothetical protein
MNASTTLHIFLVLFYFETSSFFIAYAGLELTILLLQPPESVEIPGVHYHTQLLFFLSLKILFGKVPILYFTELT